MDSFVKLFTILLLFSSALFLIGCGSSSYTSVSGSAGYGVYRGYDYPYHRYDSRYNHGIRVDFNHNNVQERKQHHKENRPERKQNVRSAKSHSGSMGRPVRAGRGGRR